MDINPKEFARPQQCQKTCQNLSKKTTGALPLGSSPDTSLGRENLFFNHINRGPYEINHLLRHLPPDLSDIKDAETWQRAEAVAKHANNSSNTLVWGLQAIGEMMVDLGNIKNYEMEVGRVVAIGDLIRHIAVELESIKEIEDGIMDAKMERDLKAAKEVA